MRVQVLGVYKLRARLLSPLVQNGRGLDPENTRPGNDLPYESHHTSFDRKIILVTAAFLFLLIAVLASHALVRWLLRHFSPSATPHPTSDPPSKPMKKRHVSALPTATFTSLGHPDIAAQCPICLADFHEGDAIRVLPTCQHGFHVGCVDRWLYKQATCPTCRADLLKGEATHQQRSRSVEVHVVITARGELCPSLSKSPT